MCIFLQNKTTEKPEFYQLVRAVTTLMAKMRTLMYEKPSKLTDGTFLKNKIILCKLKSVRRAIKNSKKGVFWNCNIWNLLLQVPCVLTVKDKEFPSHAKDTTIALPVEPRARESKPHHPQDQQCTWKWEFEFQSSFPKFKG